MRYTHPRRSQRVCEYDYYKEEEMGAKKKVKKAKKDITPKPVPKKKKK